MPPALGDSVGGISHPGTDSILLPFLLASDETEANRHLAGLLINDASPVIYRVTRSCLGRRGGPGARWRAAESQDIEEVASESSLRLIESLHRQKGPARKGSIANFIGYVTTITQHACDDFLLFKHPNRTRLRRALRYILTHKPEFSLWRSQDEQWLCGFARWRDQTEAVRSRWVNQVQMSPGEFIRCDRPDDLAGLLRETFNSAQAPVEIEDVVTLVAEILEISDEITERHYAYLSPKNLEDAVARLESFVLKPVLKAGAKDGRREPLNPMESMVPKGGRTCGFRKLSRD